jgi:hypothetical protein
LLSLHFASFPACKMARLEKSAIHKSSAVLLFLFTHLCSVLALTYLMCVNLSFSLDLVGLNKLLCLLIPDVVADGIQKFL